MKIKKAKLEDVNELIRLIRLADNRTEEVASKKLRNLLILKEDSLY
ncbi:MAG: hypothetical protein KKD18_02360 [Nanoarchaeota archaeon]|nr:hypothetical protein [Nanoarchaeota archaeon]MBU0977234.1 hypothetical protein [Nanoarchaeota archaeon]